MTRPPAIDLSVNERRLVVEVLRANLPPEAKVWVFGSRVSVRARRYSDLDLAIDCGRPLSLDEASILREAFTESDLSYKVDFVDWHSIDDGFRRLITAERVALIPGAEKEDAARRLDTIRGRIGRLRGPPIINDLRRDRDRDPEGQ